MIKKNKNLKGGFTLIETLLYIAIFSLIISGALISIYAIMGGNARIQAKAMVQEEGSFLIGKIDWALTGISSAEVYNDGKSLKVSKFNTTLYPSPIIVEIDGENLTISRDDGDSEKILNNSNIFISCSIIGDECFKHNEEDGEGLNPENVSADIIVETRTSEGQVFSEQFSTLKYLRK